MRIDEDCWLRQIVLTLCLCRAVANKSFLLTGCSPSAAVQLCFSTRRGLHVSRCFKMSKKTDSSDWEKRHCIRNQECNMLIDFVELIWLVFWRWAHPWQACRARQVSKYHVQIRMSTEILVGLGSLTRVHSASSISTVHCRTLAFTL